MYFKIIVVFIVSIAVACYSKNLVLINFVFGRSVISFPISLKAYTPSGLRVSIPHRDGLQTVSFHGKVNSPLDDPNGNSIAQDILEQSHNGQWTFEDRRVKLKAEDTLYFWIFIQYKDAGQRFNNLSSTGWELSPLPFEEAQHQEFKPKESLSIKKEDVKELAISGPSAPKAPTAPNAPSVPNSCDCGDTLTGLWAQINATAMEMHVLKENVLPLENKLKSLTEVVDALISHKNIGTKLLLFGNLPARTNPVEDVRHLLVEKLKLNDLSTSILQAEYNTKGIAFEVSSPVDKLRILKRAKDTLSKLSYSIIDYDIPIIDIRSNA